MGILRHCYGSFIQLKFPMLRRILISCCALLSLWSVSSAQLVQLAFEIQPGSGSGGPNESYVYHQKLYFSAVADTTGAELFVYDGVNPHALVADLDTTTQPFPVGSFPSDLIEYNGWLYFHANYMGQGRQMFRMNDTTPPQLVDTIGNTYTAGASYPVLFNGDLYVSGRDAAHGTELHKYSGNGPSQLVFDHFPGPSLGNPYFLTVFNNKLCYCANDGVAGIELWEYDGINPPALLADIKPGPGSSEPQDLTVVGNRLYFRADDGTHGVELWSYDGISPPALVHDLVPGISGSFPGHSIAFQGQLFYTATDNVHGYEMFSVRDTQPPVMVTDIVPGPGDAFPYQPIIYNQKLFFSAQNPAFGFEVWQHDGTNPSTRVSDLNPGSLPSFPSNYAVFQDALYLRGQGNAQIGIEMWRIQDCFGGDILAHPDSVEVCKGDSAQFTVSASGPGLQYQWYHNGVAVTNSGTTSGADADALLLTPTAPTDSGAYFCIISDTCGQQDTSFIGTLSMFEQPTITNQPVPSMLCIGDSTVLWVDATASPLTYQWFKDGLPLTNTPPYSGVQTDSLSISGAALADSGVYHVELGSGPCQSTSDTVSVEVNICPGIRDPYLSANVQVYPNPSAGQVFLSWNGMGPAPAAIEVYDVLGRKISTAPWEPGNSRMELHLTSGHHLIRTTSKTGQTAVSRVWIE